MARRILVEVDSLDGNLQRPRGMVLRVGEHRHLVLVALAGNLRYALHKCHGNAAKPRLGVAHHEPRHQEEEPARAPVSKAAPKRDLPRERSDAENKSIAVLIHETGHALGLDDYYDTVGSTGGFGGGTMMDSNVGDQDPYLPFDISYSPVGV